MSIAKIEEIREEMIPIIVGRINIKDVVLNIVNNSTSPVIEIAGIPTRKENFAAVFRSIPENNAEVRVIPDLETPGKIANDCETPIKIISFKLMSENIFFLLPRISARASNRADKIEIIAIENKPLKFDSEKSCQNTLISRPKKNIGILAIKI